MGGLMTLGQIAEHFGVPYWKVHALYRRGLLPEPERAGVSRVLPRKDLGKVERALKAVGYLQ